MAVDVPTTGARESRAFFSAHPVFTRAEFLESRSGGNRSARTADALLRLHGAGGRIVRLRQGLYASVPPGADPETFAPDPYLVASKVVDDAVVAYHGALQFFGRAYSVWNEVAFLTHRRVRPFRVGGSAFVPVAPRRSVANLPDLGGGVLREAHAGGWVRVTSLERALVDVLDAPELCGGWEEGWRSLELVEYFNLNEVLRYAGVLDRALTVARVGYFLEQHRERLFVEESHLEALERLAPRQVRYWDRSREAGQLARRWRVIIPDWLGRRSWEDPG